MSNAGKSSFVYVTYIRTTPEKLWRALTEPEFTRQYWAGTCQECEWKQGAPWRIMIPDGRVGDTGEILEIEPHKRLVLSLAQRIQAGAAGGGLFAPDLRARASRATWSSSPSSTRSTGAQSKLIEAVSGGWPLILASLKSLLETGESLAATRKWPEGM